MGTVRVLIVDDSSVMRKIIERALRQAGIEQLEVQEAATGSEALTILGAAKVDLILSDINMPAMDGLELLRQLQARKLASGVPVVMVTTESSEQHVVQAIAAGARGFLRKPFTVDEVKQRVLPLLPA